MRKYFVFCFAFTLLSSCASYKYKDTVDMTYQQPNDLEIEDEEKFIYAQEEKDEKIEEIKDPVLSFEISSEDLEKEKNAQNSDFSTLIDEANKKNTIDVKHPTDFKNGIAEYDYMDGKGYTIYCSPYGVTDLRLEIGETLTADPIIADPGHWEFSGRISGGEQGNIQHILIRPNASGTRTNMILTTNRRTYYIYLESYETIYMMAVQFRYPKSKNKITGFSSSKSNKTKTDNLNFSYIVKGNKNYKWFPQRVWDDENSTYIKFPKGFSQAHETPAVYFLSKGNNDSSTFLINYWLKKDLMRISSIASKNQGFLLVCGNERIKIIRK